MKELLLDITTCLRGTTKLNPPRGITSLLCKLDLCTLRSKDYTTRNQSQKRLPILKQAHHLQHVVCINTHASEHLQQ